MSATITPVMERLLRKQNVAVVGTVSPSGTPNLSLKGVVEVDPKGFIYFMDLYRGKTRNNIKHDPRVALTVFSVMDFQGYQFKGVASLIESGPKFDRMARAWAAKRRTILAKRIVHNIRQGHSHGRSETSLSLPKYLVKVQVDKIYNLAPSSLRPAAVKP